MKPILLTIIDGFGLRDEQKGNAVKLAKKPNLDKLWSIYPHSTLEASGRQVGLPQGQMGNSEVGHLNIGGGRIVYQPLELINKNIEEKTLFLLAILSIRFLTSISESPSGKFSFPLIFTSSGTFLKRSSILLTPIAYNISFSSLNIDIFIKCYIKVTMLIN